MRADAFARNWPVMLCCKRARAFMPAIGNWTVTQSIVRAVGFDSCSPIRRYYNALCATLASLPKRSVKIEAAFKSCFAAGKCRHDDVNESRRRDKKMPATSIHLESEATPARLRMARGGSSRRQRRLDGGGGGANVLNSMPAPCIADGRKFSSRPAEMHLSSWRVRPSS